LVLQAPASTQDFSSPPELQHGDDTKFSADFSYIFAIQNGSTIALTGWVQCTANWPANGTDFIVRQVAPTAAFPETDHALTDLLSALRGPSETPVNVASVGPHKLSTDEASVLAGLIPAGLGIWWTKVFIDHGRAYTPPGYITVTNDPVAGCGQTVSPAPADGGPFYCEAERNVYLVAQAMADRSLIGGTGTVSFIAAHESAHNVEQQYGLIGNPDPTQDWPLPIVELTADCLAGAFMRQEVDLLALTQEGFYQVMNFAHNIGGPSPADKDATHGTQAERFFITYLGFNEGVDSCTIF
jgi:predicted metalloprotease